MTHKPKSLTRSDKLTLAQAKQRIRELEAQVKTMEAVVEAARARLKVWTQETYKEIDHALAEYDKTVNWGLKNK